MIQREAVQWSIHYPCFTGFESRDNTSVEGPGVPATVRSHRHSSPEPYEGTLVHPGLVRFEVVNHEASQWGDTWVPTGKASERFLPVSMGKRYFP